MTALTRGAGVLCHISSLPGEYGIGALGKEAYRFARELAKCGVTYWQILPLVQTGFGDSPYQSVFCISGNPYFIDLDGLGEMGLLTHAELHAVRAQYQRTDVDYAALYTERYQTLRLAFTRFHFDDEAFRTFVKEGKFEDYALFMTAKTVYGKSFSDWETGIKFRDLAALERLRTDHHEEYLFWQFLQYLFWMQWGKLKAYCAQLGVRIIGDLPLYVAYDSADVWAHPELFKLDRDLKPVKVAGVPPDYFSATGQLWGNPIYDWEAHRETGYAWWHARLEAALETYDHVRIDHFRGLDRYYEIDADAETAVTGEWKQGPGKALFEGIATERIIAEDLGILDDGVRTLLKETELPGMKVLLFAFNGDPGNEHLPANLAECTVYYTGTHDNDTVMGYVSELPAEEFFLFRSRLAAVLEAEGVEVELGTRGEGIPEAMIRLALSSKARLAVIPIQDVLGLGNEARMNEPGTSGKNWRFRLKKQPSAHAMGRLKKMIKMYRR